MKVTPFFSVIIPVYNREGLILPTIQSVLEQSFSNFELIVIDDCSTDNTWDILNEIQDNRVVLFKQPTNQERGAARNKGVDISRGKYLCFLDSDDFFEKNHLQTFYDFINSKDSPVALLFSNTYHLIDGEKIPKTSPNIKDFNTFYYLLRFTFNPARTCIHRDILEGFKFDASIPGLEDVDLWLRIATKHPIIQLEEHTTTYNLHEEQYTFGDPKRHEKELRNFKTVFAKPELSGKLPSNEMNRRLAQSHYFISLKEKSFFPILRHSLKAFTLYPRGYNENSNKTMLVNVLYNFPILGNITKGLVRAFK